MIFALYTLGAIATEAYLLWLLITLPDGEISLRMRLASMLGVFIFALFWPVFWGFILYGVWLGFKHDKAWREFE